MPNFDGTGPNGKGPRTGRGKGKCKPLTNNDVKINKDIQDDKVLKFAITSTGETLNSQIDPRFARCAYFIIYNTKDNTFEAIDNPAKNEMGGAAPRAAEIIANLGAKKVFSGSFGPKALSSLESLNIQAISVNNDKTIQEVINDYK